jgi:hypothetical protein
MIVADIGVATPASICGRRAPTGGSIRSNRRPIMSRAQPTRLKQEFGYTPRMSSREAFELYARARGVFAG